MLKKKNVFNIRRKKTLSAVLGHTRQEKELKNNSLVEIDQLKAHKVGILEEDLDDTGIDIEKNLNESFMTLELSDIENAKNDVNRLDPLNDAKKLLNKLKNNYSDIYDEVI